MSSITRQRLLLGLGVLFNFLLPWAVYRLSEPHAGESRAIMISAGVPALWSLVQFARNRSVDVMSMIVLSGLALSLVALALGGSPKLLLFRESLITGFMGLVFIGSAIVRRPLMFVLVRAASRQSALDVVVPKSIAVRARAELESYAANPAFRGVMAVMTIGVGVIAVAETVTLSLLISSMPTERVLLIRPIVRYAVVGLLLLLTFLYFVPAVRRADVEEEPTERAPP